MKNTFLKSKENKSFLIEAKAERTGEKMREFAACTPAVHEIFKFLRWRETYARCKFESTQRNEVARNGKYVGKYKIPFSWFFIYWNIGDLKKKIAINCFVNNIPIECMVSYIPIECMVTIAQKMPEGNVSHSWIVTILCVK